MKAIRVGGLRPAWVSTTAMVALYEIRAPVNTCDTAATLAYIFQAAPPAAWIARPVREAFEFEQPASCEPLDAAGHA